MNRPDGTLLMEETAIMFRNFAGKEGMYNREGDRNFCVPLDSKTADEMARDGWNVKHLRAREEGDEPQAYIQVSVKYRGKDGATVRPPTIVMITSQGRTPLTEDESEILDWVDIASVDLVLRPYSWAVSGKSGIKAYLKTLYVTIEEDYLDLKYAELPVAGEAAAELTTGHDEDGIWDAEVVGESEVRELEA